MAIIRQLKNWFTKQNIYPQTVEQAVYDKDGNRLDNKLKELNGILDVLNSNLSHIGMIIHSTTLDTEEKVKAIYGGIKWEKIEGKFLLGTSNSHAINSIGGEETHTLTTNEIPSHNHTGPSHSHGLNAHTHSIPSLSGSTSSVGSHYHHMSRKVCAASGTDYACMTDTDNPSKLDNKNTSTDGAHTHSVTTNASYTGGNSGNTAAAGTGNTGSTGGGTAHNNMPPYKTVYIWERTA